MSRVFNSALSRIWLIWTAVIYHVEQELLVNTFEENPNDPAEDRRQIPGQRKGLALHIGATVFL